MKLPRNDTILPWMANEDEKEQDNGNRSEM